MQGFRLELFLVDGEAEDEHHHERRRRERRPDGVITVKHHEDIEIEHRHHRKDDGDDVTHRVRDAPEAVGVDIRHESEGGAAVCRHRGKSDEQAYDERHKIVLSERSEHTHSHKTERRDHGADDDDGFAVAEGGVDLVREPPEEGEKDETKDVVRGDDDPVEHGVQPENIVIYGLHDRVVGAPEERDPTECQRTQQSPFQVEFHKIIITSNKTKSNPKARIRETKHRV